METVSGPAYRIETARTSLRCLEPKHTAVVARAILESLEHLRPFMPWTAHEPRSFAQRVERMRTFRGHFDLGSDYTYGIFEREREVLLGVMGLKLGPDTDERELGYWLHVHHIGQGYAFEGATALLRVGFDIEGLANVDIRVDPDNLRSARLAQKLGFVGPLLEPLSDPASEGGKRDTHVYSLSRVEYAQNPARFAVIEAYDVLERPIPLPERK